MAIKSIQTRRTGSKTVFEHRGYYVSENNIVVLCLGSSKKKDFFTGVVIDPGDSMIYPHGYYSTSFIKSLFSRFTGSITIKVE